MLVVVVGEHKTQRQDQLQKIIGAAKDSEVITLDDTLTMIEDLEQYAYPSLFSLTAPIVHTKYILDGKAGDLTLEVIQKLHSSPTLFLFEEFTLPAALLTQLKKQKVVIHTSEKIAKEKSEATIFSVTNAITAGDKKSRWFAYREALTDHPVEAVMGILYWKVRDLLARGGRDEKKYRELYHALITAHAKAWETGAPLELMIEKVILEQ